MALNKASLKSGIQSLCGHSNTAEEFATGLADLIDAYVKTGTVTVTGELINPANSSLANTGGPVVGKILTGALSGTIS